MNIHDLMREDQKNEEMEEKHESIRKWLFPLSVGCILAFGVWILSGNIRSVGGAYIFLIGLFLSMYLFYSGLSAWIICYVKKKRPPDLPGTESVSNAAVCIEVKDDAFYDGNADGAFYGCLFRMFGGADVYRLAKTGAWH